MLFPEKSKKDERVEKGATAYIKPSRTCPYCKKECGEKLTRHLSLVHKHEDSVKNALKLPRNERMKAMACIRKEGILFVNQQKIQEENPQYERERRSKGSSELKICGICKGFYSKEFYKRHKSKYCQGEGCLEACAVPVSLLTSDMRVNKEFPEFTSEILAKFQNDSIGKICITDEVIVNIGQRMWMKERGKQDKKTQVRKTVMANMRRLSSLYIQFQEQHQLLGTCPLGKGNAEDMFQRRQTQVLFEAIRVLTTSDKDESVKSGLKIGLKFLILSACTVIKATHLAKEEDADAEEIDKFVAVFRLNDNFLFGDAVYTINKNRQVKLRKPHELPLEDDMQTLRLYSITKAEEMLNDKYMVWDGHSFIQLRDLVVARLTLFNARRGGEPCRLKINEWNEALQDVWIDKQRTDAVDDPIGKELLENIKVTYQTGKGNNHLVPVLFPKDTVEAMKLLTDKETRTAAGVHEANDYVFASTQNSSFHVSGWHALNGISSAAGIHNTAHINATKNRHRVSTLYAAMDLPQSKRELFFKHMGHSGEINADIYQAPLAIQEVTQVGRVLQQIDSSKNNLLQSSIIF